MLFATIHLLLGTAGHIDNQFCPPLYRWGVLGLIKGISKEEGGEEVEEKMNGESERKLW